VFYLDEEANRRRQKQQPAINFEENEQKHDALKACQSLYTWLASHAQDWPATSAK